MKTKPKLAKGLRAEIQMPISDLRVGMFVSRPDCGWHKTPFMLEGFLIRDSREISTLAQFAKHVIVDPRRSQLKVFDDQYLREIYIDAATPAKAPGKRQRGSAPALENQAASSRKKWGFDWHRPIEKSSPAATAAPLAKVRGDHDAGITGIVATERDIQFKEYLLSIYADWAATAPHTGFLASVTRWVRNLGGAANNIKGGRPRKPRPVPSKANPAYIPADTALVIYPEPEPTYFSLAKAQVACDHVEETLGRILDDISKHGISDVETLREAADTVVDNMIARPDTMMWIAKMRAYSNARYQQALSVAIHLTALGRQIGFQREQLADLAGVGLLLDMGKVTIDAALLNKPARLTPSEIEIIRTHVQQGLKMFGESGNLPDVMTRAIAEHHEREDGTGYPNSLGGKDISIYGKMAAIADSFVAMVNPRPYAPTYTAYDAIRQLFRESDSRWFRPLVEQFVQSIGIFPVGSLIEISTGELAIVVQHNRVRRMEPKVLVLTNREKLILDRPWDLDMLRHNQIATNTEIRILKGVADGAYGIDFRKYYLRTQ